MELSQRHLNDRASLDFLLDFYHRVYADLPTLVRTAGYVGLAAIIFAETGLVVAPFLPGDSLLFVIGALCGMGSLELQVAMPLLILAAFMGDNTNYWVGRLLGLRLIVDLMYEGGIGTMNYRHYVTFSILGGVSWIGSLILAGYFFGNIPIIKDNLVLMILAIIFISFIPAILEFIKHRRRQA